MREPLRLFLASSNPGKLREYLSLAGDADIALDLLPDFAALPAFEETAPTFAENASGKALHYSRFADSYVLADDSGLVVPTLGGAPGVHSARYAGPQATDEDRVRKLLGEMAGMSGEARRAQFVCITAIARRGRCHIITSDRAEGLLLEEPRGGQGFGYDPIFFFPELGKTYAELSRQEKNRVSHRGKSFRKALALLLEPNSVILP